MASAIGLMFMAIDFCSALFSFLSGIDPFDPPTATGIIVIGVFTCVSNAVESLLQQSIEPIVTSLIINTGLILVGVLLVKWAQTTGRLFGLAAIFFIPIITFVVHASLLEVFFRQCGANCYRVIGPFPYVSEFIDSFSIF
ncbi:MAG: hypothetical protein AAFR58_21695 [Cyanobacteria bacterium J06627_28]